VTLYPVAPPPYLNTPGQVLSFALEGYDGEDPDALAEWMDQVRRDAYIPPPGQTSTDRRERLRLTRRNREFG
jgi:hypothetical protein